jgi:carbon storage regulator
LAWKSEPRSFGRNSSLPGRSKDMLVLSRRKGERILVGNDVVLTVVAIRGNRVRIGIEAPPEVHVLRDEIPRFETPLPAHGMPVEAVLQQSQ